MGLSAKSKIEWTDTTWNPVRGCTKISPGCKNCYAETFAERWRGVPGHPYEQGFGLRLVPEKLDEPLRWKKPRRIFVNSMSDLFQEGVPAEFIDQVFMRMARCHWHTFQVLTKRPERMLKYLQRFMPDGQGWLTPNGRNAVTASCSLADNNFPIRNVWLGISVENQQYADERIPLLLQTPAAKRFVSYEPALGPVDFSRICDGTYDAVEGTNFEDLNPWPDRHTHLDWVIVGGESGPGARPFNVQWARSVVQQCKAAGVACFVKQLGGSPMEHPSQIREWPPESQRRFKCLDTVGPLVKMMLQDRKGGDMAEWPDDLRVRQFPPIVETRRAVYEDLLKNGLKKLDRL